MDRWLMRHRNEEAVRPTRADVLKHIVSATVQEKQHVSAEQADNWQLVPATNLNRRPRWGIGILDWDSSLETWQRTKGSAAGYSHVTSYSGWNVGAPMAACPVSHHQNLMPGRLILSVVHPISDNAKPTSIIWNLSWAKSSELFGWSRTWALLRQTVRIQEFGKTLAVHAGCLFPEQNVS